MPQKEFPEQNRERLSVAKVNSHSPVIHHATMLPLICMQGKESSRTAINLDIKDVTLTFKNVTELLIHFVYKFTIILRNYHTNTRNEIHANNMFPGP